MSGNIDSAIHDLLAGSVTLLLVAGGLYLLIRRLSSSRPGFSIGVPIAAAMGIRVLATVGVSLTGIGESLRGGDEPGFVLQAHEIASAPLGSELWIDSLAGELYKFVFASQIRLFDSPELALRMMQAGIAVAGLVLLAVAVYELAGARAATIAMWFLAIEPTNIFFSTLLHKEANMLLAAGLVAYGGALIWKRGELRPLVAIAGGCLIAVATRPYAGWFLLAAGAAIVLHAGLRAQHRGSARGLTAVAMVVVLAAVAAPTLIGASSEESLQTNLQSSQDANASDDASLSLEQVDFSTRGALITNLPVRIKDVLFRPYVWQIDNASQQLGLIGSLVALGLMAALARELILNRGAIMERAGPLLYLTFFMLITYSLSAGNAGTAFRYRTHVVALATCAFVAMWLQRRQAQEAAPLSRPFTGEVPHLASPHPG